MEISRSARPLGEQDAVEELERIGDVVHKFSIDVDDLVSKRDRVNDLNLRWASLLSLFLLQRPFR